MHSKSTPEVIYKNGPKASITYRASNKPEKTPIPDNVREELTKLNNRISSLRNTLNDIKAILLPKDVLCNLLEDYRGKEISIMLPCGTTHRIILTHYDKFVIAGNLIESGKKKIFIRSRCECIDLP